MALVVVLQTLDLLAETHRAVLARCEQSAAVVANMALLSLLLTAGANGLACHPPKNR